MTGKFKKPFVFLSSNNLLQVIFVCILMVSFFSFKKVCASENNESKIATEKIVVRKPADEKINSFREQRDFSYSKSLKPVDSVWGKFWRWLGQKIEELLAKTSYNYFWKPLFYLILIASVIFIAMKLFGVEIRSFFTKAPATVAIPYHVVEENIHELNLDDLISQAAERKNYRLAVRYLYLKILKQLNDSGNIEWKPGKTNRMYANELRKGNLYGSFNYLTTQFEYIWYGEFEVNEHSFENVKSRFVTFGNGVSNNL